MLHTLPQALARNFLGYSPDWYKLTIVAFLVINPIVYIFSPQLAGWMIVLEFIFTLAMALKCYPLQPGGLIALEAILIGLTTPDAVYHETVNNFPVILLLMFMVAGIYFLRDLLLFVFTKIILTVQSKVVLSMLFCGVAAFLSAFLDALTVMAVIISVGAGFYGVFHKVASGKRFHHDHDSADDSSVHDAHRRNLNQFRRFLRQLMMHGAVGTALGGVMTIVGEPQNLLIGKVMGWEFGEFFSRMSVVSIPVFIAGLITCYLVERFRVFGYGATLPGDVRTVLEEFDQHETEKRSLKDVANLWVQAIVVVILILSLGFHLAEVGLVGLMIVVLATAFTGVTEEHRIGHAFEEALPFTALLVVFFSVVAVIESQHLFSPVINAVLAMNSDIQVPVFYIANGLLSMISDNVFVA
ncbi:MAG: sodium/proton antiporter NhaB, partial [Gammaproteobacteria bacterium]|nr:sodium/proton antiporter NhaB [Gammaproteobacteria bacterium]